MHKLYFGPGACSFVPHAALEIIKAATGEEFETQMVKLHKGEQNSPEFRAINPDGQVPVLAVDGQALTQIVAIAQYLDAKYPQLEMLPKDPWARARTLSTMAWMNNTVHPTFTHIFMPFKYAEDKAALAEMKRYNTLLFTDQLKRIENTLIAKADPYINGAKIGFLDLYAVVFLRWGGLAGIDPDSMPAYKAFVDRIAAVPPVSQALVREAQPLHYFKKAA
jgi:glutathione S-transferase